MFALYVPVGRKISENSSAFIWAKYVVSRIPTAIALSSQHFSGALTPRF